ncbi:hypothetical protein, partial [Aliivibrio fischeri]|uniref:hypothetical protein n=1 Tax=Aliivibrio fischeri TaxID=668 RepID=UPI001F5296F7
NVLCRRYNLKGNLLMNLKFEELSWLFNDLMMDMTAPSIVFKELGQIPGFVPENPSYLSINRMCLSQLIIALCKFHEIYSKFGVYDLEFKTMPQELFNSLQSIDSEITRREIYKFRNVYVGHAFKERRKGPKIMSRKPLSLEEGQSRLNTIVANDYLDFYDWVCPQDLKSSDGSSVVEIITRARDYCNEQGPEKLIRT